MEVAATATAALGLRAAHVREHIFLVNFFVVSDDVATKPKLFRVPKKTHKDLRVQRKAHNKKQNSVLQFTFQFNDTWYPGKIKIF